MGYYAGIEERLPDEYDPWWEEREWMSNLCKMWHLGHESGYSKGLQENVRNQKYEDQIEVLKNLVGANYRVMKKEIEEEIKEQIRDKNLLPAQES